MQMLVIGLGVLALAGCSTYEKTVGTRSTTTNYDTDGKISSTVVYETDVSDYSQITNGKAMTEAVRSGDDGKATDRGFDFTKIGLGYADIGLDWTSISVNSTGAPAEATDSDKVLANIASVKKAAKTTLQTDKVAVNTNVSAKTETATVDAVATPEAAEKSVEAVKAATPADEN